MQLAIRDFRRRSLVVTNSKSNSLTLWVNGTNRDRIKKKLEAWIDAYKNRIETMAHETSSLFLDRLISRWTKVETDARAEPAGFKAKHPDVSRSRLDHIRGETTELQFLTRQLLVEIEVGAGLDDPSEERPQTRPQGDGAAARDREARG